jgi:hypothetical protein
MTRYNWPLTGILSCLSQNSPEIQKCCKLFIRNESFGTGLWSFQVRVSLSKLKRQPSLSAVNQSPENGGTL